jgi:hypothetical protein
MLIKLNSYIENEEILIHNSAISWLQDKKRRYIKDIIDVSNVENLSKIETENDFYHSIDEEDNDFDFKTSALWLAVNESVSDNTESEDEIQDSESSEKEFLKRKQKKKRIKKEKKQRKWKILKTIWNCKLLK